MSCTRAAFDGLSAEIKHKDNTHRGAAERKSNTKDNTYAWGGWGLDLAGADLAEQAAQEPREHHRRAVIAAAASCSPLCVFEQRHRIAQDAQVVLPRDLV
jgi:hypothetical protein